MLYKVLKLVSSENYEPLSLCRAKFSRVGLHFSVRGAYTAIKALSIFSEGYFKCYKTIFFLNDNLSDTMYKN